MILSSRGDETGKQKRQRRGGRERGGMKMRMKNKLKRLKKADEKKASAKKLHRPVFSGGTHRSATEKNTPRDATSGEIKG